MQSMIFVNESALKLKAKSFFDVQNDSKKKKPNLLSPIIHALPESRLWNLSILSNSLIHKSPKSKIITFLNFLINLMNKFDSFLMPWLK